MTSKELTGEAAIEECFRWAIRHNLNQLVQFHNHTRRLFHLAKDEAEGLDETEHRLWMDYNEKHYPEKLRISVFLMMFGHIEETLLLIYQRSKAPILKRQNGLEKYKPLLQRAFKSELGSNKAWSYLLDASKVRHALLHTGGRVSMMRKPEELKRIARQRRGSFTIKSDRIRVETEALSQLADQTHEFLMDLNRRLQALSDKTKTKL